MSVGKTKIAIDVTDVTNGDSIASYLVDAAGALLTSSLVGAKQSLDVNSLAEHLQGSAYAAGVDYLSSVGAVDDNGNWSPLSLDPSGNLKVTANVTFTAEHNEDDPFTNGDSGIFTLLVRQDTLATSTSTDGDYGAFKSNSLGELYVHDTDVKAQLVSANSTLTNIKSDTASIVTNTANTASNTSTISSTLTALSKAEDAPAASGDQGIQSLLVRQDTLASSTSTDGDYGSFKSNNLGELYVHDTSVLAQLTSINGYYFAEDAAHVSGDKGIQALAVRRDSQGTNVSTNGDYSSLLTWSEGSLKVVDVANGSILQQQLSVTNTATALPAAPLASRKSLLIQNTGTAKVYIGNATVTSSGATTGVELTGNSFIELDAGPDVVVYGIKSGAAGNTVNILESA